MLIGSWPHGASMNWSTAFALISAATGLVSAVAALWAAGSAASANRQAARERRAVLEREASRGHGAVPPVAARVAGLAERLEREYTTLFALAGRNVSAAAGLREQAAKKQYAADEIAGRMRVWLPGPVESRTDRELQDLIQAADQFMVQLEQMEQSLAVELRSVEEQIRPLRARTLGAHES